MFSYMNEYMIKVEVGSFIVVFSTPGSHSNANWEIFPAEVHQPWTKRFGYAAEKQWL